MAVTSTIPRGTLLSGKYRVERELGRGGMAAVYRATNVDIGKEVAIKLLAVHLATSQTVVERFLREARAVSKIKSPHICDVFDFGRLEDGTPFLVMELLEGESLYDAMCRDRQMSPEVTLAIILQVARGLSKAHELNIVHRDLKPENIFLTVDDDGHLLVKILDFGLAKFYDPVELKGKGKKHARLTREGAVFGTPAYMSPEQVRGQAAADTRADLWALACITYECFTGTTVWSTDDGVAMTFAQIATAPLPDPRAYRPDLPQSFNDWFHRALNRDISARYQTVSDFADGLAAAFDYRGAGLDARLVDQITHKASGDSDSVTQRRSARPMAPSPTSQPIPSQPIPSQPIPSQPTQPLASHPSGPHSSPLSSASPSPVSLHEPAPLELEPPKRGVLRKLVGGVLIGGLAAAAAFSYKRLDQQTPEPIVARSFGNVAANIVPSASEPESGHKYVAQHPWLPDIRLAQALIAEGKHDEALALLRRVHEQQQHPMVRSLIDQVEIATQGRGSNAPCQVTGYARPRHFDLLSEDRKADDAGAPTISVGIGGALMTWVDSRDGQRRAYAVPLDDRLRNNKLEVDITPEGTRVVTPTLLAVPEKFLSIYWDSAGSNPGVFVRWIGADAVIAGPPVRATDQPNVYYATGARTSDGGFVVTWTERVDSDSVDLFYRRYDGELAPLGGPVRVTDYVNRGSSPTRVQGMQVVEHKGKLHFSFEYIVGNVQEIRYIRVPTNTPPPGIQPLEAGADREDRTLAEQIEVTPASVKGRFPAMACNDNGCFVTWSQTLPNGAGVAFIDAEGKRQWHKPFSNKGRHPGVAIAANGDVQLVWIENQRILTAGLGRDGVGPSSKVARIIGDQPPPAIAPGSQRGEWYVAWLDIEHNHREPYAARIQCQ